MAKNTISKIKIQEKWQGDGSHPGASVLWQEKTVVSNK